MTVSTRAESPTRLPGRSNTHLLWPALATLFRHVKIYCYDGYGGHDEPFAGRFTCCAGPYARLLILAQEGAIRRMYAPVLHVLVSSTAGQAEDCARCWQIGRQAVRHVTIALRMGSHMLRQPLC